MLVNTLKYPYINAKLKGMNSKNLNKEDFEDLLKQNNLQSANAILKKKLYHLDKINETAGRLEIEEKLDKILIDDIEKIKKILNENERKIFEIYISEYEIKCIIKILKSIVLGVSHKEEIADVNIWTEKLFKDIYGIANSKNIEELLQKAKKSIYYNTLRSNLEVEKINLFEIETKLNKQYYEDIFKCINNKCKKLIGEKIDLLNILYIYRMNKFYNIEETKKVENLINVYYKIEKNELINLFNKKNYVDFIDELKKTVYKDVFNNEEDLEIDIKKYMYKLYKKTFNESKYNFVTIISYLCMDKIEVNNIINIIGGIEYGLNKNEIQKKIIF